MKKSTLLSLLTAASIVVTTAGTYAAWDSVEASTSESITFRNPVTVTVAEEYTLTEESPTLDTNPTVSGTVEFTVSGNEKELADTLTIVPTVSGASSDINDFTFTIKDGTGLEATSLNGSAEGGFVDNTISTTNTYTVEVTAKNDELAGKEVNIELTATLSKAE